MANIPLIPGTQQTFSRFKRRGKNTPVYFDRNADEKSGFPRHSIRRRLGDRRKLILRVRLERRSNQERRNQHIRNSTNSEKHLTGKGRHINTSA